MAGKNNLVIIGGGAAGMSTTKWIGVPDVAIPQVPTASSVLSDPDLSYAPPFIPVWEAGPIAAQEMEKKLAARGKLRTRPHKNSTEPQSKNYPITIEQLWNNHRSRYQPSALRATSGR